MSGPTKAYRVAWLVDRERGISRTVPSQRVTDHVRDLLAAGMTVRGIALAAHVSASTVVRFRDDHYPTCQRAVAARLMRVQPQAILDRPDRDGQVPKIGTVRRIQALLAIGWRHSDITAHMPGVRTGSAAALNQAGDRVSAATHRAVKAAYDDLSMRSGPSKKTRTLASRMGYAPPLAWDDETIDDPQAQPSGAGWQRGSLDLDEWVRLVRSGEAPSVAARRCGFGFAWEPLR